MDPVQVQVVDEDVHPGRAVELVKAWSKEGIQLHDIAIMFRTQNQVAELKERLAQQSTPYIENADELWNLGKAQKHFHLVRLSEVALSNKLSLNRIIQMFTTKIGPEAMKALRAAAKARNTALNDLMFEDTKDVLLPADEVWYVFHQLESLGSAAENGSTILSPFTVHNMKSWVASFGRVLGDADHPSLDASHLECVDQLRHQLVFLKSLAHHGKAKDVVFARQAIFDVLEPS